MPTLYVSDLDGTLLNREGRLSPYTIRVLQEVQQREDVYFSYATARSHVTAAQVTQGLTVALPVIVYNGAFIIENGTGRVLDSCGFSGEEVAAARALFAACELSPLVYSRQEGKDRVSFLSQTGNSQPGNRGLARYFAAREGDPRFCPVETEEALYAGDVFYFTCIMDQREAGDALLQALGDDPRFRCTLQQELYTPEYFLELMSPQATKANAARRLKELLGCERVVAFGDAINDLPLFAAADECYAVENAVEALKAAATGVIPSNAQDGVARWLAEHVLGE